MKVFCRYRKNTLFILILIAILILSVSCASRKEPNDRPPPVPAETPGPIHPRLNDEELAKNLIVKITGKDTAGAGIIFGKQGDVLFMATANHVVRHGKKEFQDLRVRFRFWDEEFKPEVSPNYEDNKGLDLTVLTLNLANSFLPAVILNRSLPSEKLSYRDDEDFQQVHPVGHPRELEWYTPSTLVTVWEIEGENIVLDFTCDAGFSGGAIFDDQWRLAGMLRTSSPPACGVIHFECIHEKLEEWQFDVNLLIPLSDTIFRVKRVVVENTSGNLRKPVNETYFVRVGETVIIKVEVEHPRNHTVMARWEARTGEVSSIARVQNGYTVTRMQNGYIAERAGVDIVTVYIKNQNNGDRLEYPIIIRVVQ